MISAADLLRRVYHVWTSIPALQRDFAGDCVQSVPGIFPGVAGGRGAGDEPDRREDESARLDHGSVAVLAAGKPEYRFRVFSEARAGSLEDRRVGLDWDVAGRLAGDEAGHARNS